jgi:transcription termination/antitermination protein NusG
MSILQPTKNWYIINVHVGHEEKVSEALKQRAESLDLADKIFQTLVPKEKQVEVKNGKKRIVNKRIFPGYVFIQMVMTEETWFAVRNTPGVTGFASAVSGQDPQPVSDEEVARITKRMDADVAEHKVQFRVGDVISINDGPFKGFDGAISEIDSQKGKLKVMVNMFGRETPVEIDALQVTRH